MGKVLLQTLAGLILLIGGLVCSYIGLTGINDGQAWMLLPALLLCGASGFLLFRAGKSDATVLFKGKKVISIAPEEKPGFESTLEKNNQMDSEFGKTNDARNRLKMLQLAGDAGKES